MQEKVYQTHIANMDELKPASSGVGRAGPQTGRLKMREWKMRYGQKCKAGICRSWVAVWETERRLFRETAFNYLLKVVCRILTE